MGWREKLQPASFKSVAFFVEGHDVELGRRVQVHEYPLRDKPFAEDLGRKARTLSIECLVLGADYMARRDALLEAVEMPGPGLLRHPYLGELRCTVTGCRLRESTADGGVARFTLQLVEAGEAVFLNATPDLFAKVQAANAALLEASGEQFAQRYTVQGKPQFVAQGAWGVVQRLLSHVQAAAQRLRAAGAPALALAAQVRDVKQAGLALVYDAVATRDALENLVLQVLLDAAATPRQVLVAARPLLRFAPLYLAPVGGTVARRVEAANAQALTHLVRTTALLATAQVVAQMPFESLDEATAVRDELCAGADALQVDVATSDAVFDALRDWRVAVVRDVAARGADLARVVRYTPASTLPALVVAHHLYADALREPELVARNRLAHPGFVPGGLPLEALTDG